MIQAVEGKGTLVDAIETPRTSTKKGNTQKEEEDKDRVRKM